MRSLKKLIMMANQGSDSSSLPSHLERAEYLESTGTQYIDLGYPLGYENKVVVDIYSQKISGNNVVFGVNNPVDKRFVLNISTTQVPIAFGNAQSAAPKYEDKRQKCTVDYTGVDINGVFYKWDKPPYEFTTEGNVFLFAVNTLTTYGFLFKGKIYSCQIYEHDTLIHDYIPAFNSESRRPCMYDTITGIELYNQGTGEFNYHIEGKPIPYLAFEALEDDLQVSITKSATQYSLDRVNWVDLPAEEQTPPIAKGEKVWFRAEIIPDGTNTGIGTFSCTKQCNLEGTPMSLLYGDRAGDVLSLPNKTYCFSYLFAYNDKIIRVNNPMEFLPAMMLTGQYCYYNMFSRCYNLQNAPYLPANLNKYCYYGMFQYCYSLNDVYDFPIWSITNNSGYQSCYYMFRYCISLVKQPYMPMNKDVGCSYMFYGCVNMVESQETIHSISEYMYYNTKLAKSPELVNGTLTYASYSFAQCSYLEVIPSAIRFSKSNQSSGQHMFENCVLIKTSPIISIEDEYTPQAYTWRYMFANCISLNYITFLPLPAPDSATQYMYQWVNNVAPKGTIVLNKNIEWNPEDYRGVNGIPEGWEVKYCDPDNLDDIRDYREIDKAWNE